MAAHGVLVCGVHSISNISLDLATVVRGAVGVVEGFAGTEAAAIVGVPLAHTVGVTLSVGGKHTAARLTDVVGSIPHAFAVTITGPLVNPAELTDLVAGALSGLPDAHGLVLAGALAVNLLASLTALRDIGEPHATINSNTGGLVDVGNGASAEALGTVPCTELIIGAVAGDVVEGGTSD